MFEKLKNRVAEGKDKVTSATLRRIVNQMLKQRAPGIRVERLRINSTRKNIVVTLRLPELEEPITIKAFSYRITEKNKKHFLEVERLEKSQEWANGYIDGKRYKIPPRILKAAEVILSE